MIFIATSIALTITAAICRSVQHVIKNGNRYELSIFMKAPAWLQRFLLQGSKRFPTRDGFHVAAGLNDHLCTLTLLPAFYWHLSSGINPFWLLTYFPVWFNLYYSTFNLCYHRILMLTADRPFLNCISVLEILGWLTATPPQRKLSLSKVNPNHWRNYDRHSLERQSENSGKTGPHYQDHRFCRFGACHLAAALRGKQKEAGKDDDRQFEAGLHRGNGGRFMIGNLLEKLFIKLNKREENNQPALENITLLIKRLSQQALGQAFDRGQNVPFEILVNAGKAIRDLNVYMSSDCQRPGIVDMQTLKRLRLLEEHLKDFPFELDDKDLLMQPVKQSGYHHQDLPAIEGWYRDYLAIRDKALVAEAEEVN